MTQAKLYVHCGFHKTGSTALQTALRASEGPLRQAGFLYPYTGSLNRAGRESIPRETAHHNLGWEMMRNRLFRHEHGTIADLAAEVSAFTGNVIISSEDFESIMAVPGSFAPLQRIASNTGRQLVLIIYLRNQISYCESMYQELLKHGGGEEYLRHAATILETGYLRVRDGKIEFDYEHLLRKWENVPDVRVIVRNYHALAGNSVIVDFAKVIGVEGILHARTGHELVNERQTNTQSLARFYRNRVGWNLSPQETARIKYLGQKTSRLTSSPPLHEAFVRRFRASNISLCEQWDVPTAGLDMQDTPQAPSEVTLEQFFSFETQCAIRSGTVPETCPAPGRTVQTGWMAGIETAGSNVLASEKIRYRLGRFGAYRRWYTQRLRNLILSRPPSETG